MVSCQVGITSSQGDIREKSEIISDSGNKRGSVMGGAGQKGVLQVEWLGKTSLRILHLEGELDDKKSHCEKP